MNAAQASKTNDVDADLVELQGRPLPSDADVRASDASGGSTGVLATACLEGEPRHMGSPIRWRRGTANESPRGTDSAGADGGEARSTDDTG